MSSTRAVRYRKLALAAKVKADADLLLKLAEECDRGLLCVAEWRSELPYRKMCSFQEWEANARFECDPFNGTVVENLRQTAARH
jgi:hypothetical protein